MHNPLQGNCLPNVSVYNGVRDRKGVTVPIDNVVNRIRSGKRGLAERTHTLSILAQTDPEAYKKEKTKLPAVTWSGTFQNRKELIVHSGYIVLDFDDIDIGTVLSELAHHPNVFLAFVSPSKMGVKAIIPVDPIPTTPQEHKHAFETVCEAFEVFGEIDPSGSDVTRLCFLAHDPRAIYNPNARAIEWEPEEIPAPADSSEQARTFAGTTDLEALDYVPADDYETWYQVGLALYREGQPIDVWIQWSRKSDKAEQNTPEMYSSKWASFASEREEGITWGSVIHMARANGYKPRRNHKPIKLQKSDIACVTEPIEKAREALREAFTSEERFIGVRADTGIGKTHEAIQLYQKKGVGGFISTPTGDLADEVARRLDIAEVDAFRWKGLHHRDANGNYTQCQFPEEYTAYAESGRNVYQMLCESCPDLTQCEDNGYRSQEAKAKKAQVVVAAHKDVLMNPLFRSTAKRLLPSHKDDLILIDEFNVFDFIKIVVTQARLEYLRDTWHDHPLGDFAIDMLHALIIQNAPHTGIASILDDLSEHPTKQHSIREGLASYRVGGTVYSRKEANKIEAHKSKDTDTIKALPKIETAEWNLYTQLELFLAFYPHAAGAPIQWKDNTLTFEIPPQPLYTKAKVLCMSATLNEAFFKQVFRHRQAKRNDVGFIDAADTEWHPEAKVYQLRTNRNPRGTLLTSEKDEKGQWHYTGLTPTGQEALDQTIAYSKAHPDKQHALISYKWVTQTYQSALSEAGILTGHYGNIVGLNQHFRRDDNKGIVLTLLGAPEIPPDEVVHRYNLLYGNRETQPDFTRDPHTGEYHDTLLQTVYEACVKSEIVQAFGRAGLVRNPSLVIIRTRHELPSVTHREQTRLFDETDEQGNLDDLHNNILAREAREQAEAAAIASGDVQAVVQATGQSQRTAERKTKAVRAQQKADRDAEILRLHQQEHSHREIHQQRNLAGYKVSLGTIGSVIRDRAKNDTAYIGTSIEAVANCAPPETLDGAHVDAIIDQLNAGLFDRAAIAENLNITREALADGLSQFYISDPRLSEATRDRMKAMHQAQRPPDLAMAWRPPDIRLILP